MLIDFYNSKSQLYYLALQNYINTKISGGGCDFSLLCSFQIMYLGSICVVKYRMHDKAQNVFNCVHLLSMTLILSTLDFAYACLPYGIDILRSMRLCCCFLWLFSLESILNRWFSYSIALVYNQMAIISHFMTVIQFTLSF